ncbi:MAG: hypothetical protein ACTJLM_05330 [Ehrlichia sp.]
MDYYRSKIKVKHFTKEEKLAHTRIIRNDEKGVLRVYSKIYDTSGYTGKTFEECVAYAISLQGELVTCQHCIKIHSNYEYSRRAYSFFHSTLLSCMPGICFGMIKIKKRKNSL